MDRYKPGMTRLPQVIAAGLSLPAAAVSVVGHGPVLNGAAPPAGLARIGLLYRVLTGPDMWTRGHFRGFEAARHQELLPPHPNPLPRWGEGAKAHT